MSDPAKKAAKWKRYYERNKARESARSIQKSKALIVAVKAYLLDYLLGHPCIGCGESDPVVLDFDHRDPSQKLFGLAVARRGKHRLEKVKAEVAKCDVRCANCHRRRTAEQDAAGEIVRGRPATGRGQLPA